MPVIPGRKAPAPKVAVPVFLIVRCLIKHGVPELEFRRSDGSTFYVNTLAEFLALADKTVWDAAKLAALTPRQWIEIPLPAPVSAALKRKSNE